jgi:hypothetical protein
MGDKGDTARRAAMSAMSGDERRLVFKAQSSMVLGGRSNL